MLSTTGRSEGEVIRVAAASQQQNIPERDIGHPSPTRSKSPRTRSPQGGASYQRGLSSPQKGKSSQKRSQSPHYRTQSPTRVSFEGLHTVHLTHICYPNTSLIYQTLCFHRVFI